MEQLKPEIVINQLSAFGLLKSNKLLKSNDDLCLKQVKDKK